MSLPGEWLTVATLGTERRAIDGTGFEYWVENKSKTPESQFLTMIGIESFRRQSGWQPYHEPPIIYENAPPPIDVTVRPPCNPPTMLLLRDCIAYYPDILWEWFWLALHIGRRVSEEVIPQVLTLGHQHKDLRAMIYMAIWEPGQWFTAQFSHPHWEWVYTLTPQDMIALQTEITTNYEPVEKELANIIRKRPDLQHNSVHIYQDIYQYTRVWEKELGTAMLEAIQYTIPQAQGFPAQLFDLMRHSCLYIPYGLIQPFLELVEGKYERLQAGKPYFAYMKQVLEFRRFMNQVFHLEVNPKQNSQKEGAE